MDEFLLITDMSWIEVENANTVFLDIATIVDLIYGQEWNSLSQEFEQAGVLPANGTLSECRTVNTGTTLADIRVWYRL